MRAGSVRRPPAPTGPGSEPVDPPLTAWLCPIKRAHWPRSKKAQGGSDKRLVGSSQTERRGPVLTHAQEMQQAIEEMKETARQIRRKWVPKDGVPTNDFREFKNELDMRLLGPEDRATVAAAAMTSAEAAADAFHETGISQASTMVEVPLTPTTSSRLSPFVCQAV